MEFTKELAEWLEGMLKRIDSKAKVSLKQPWDALKLLERFSIASESIQGQIEVGAKWDVPMVLGKNSIIKAPSRIEGPVIIGENTMIGPFAYIRGPAIIGSDCKISSSEVKQSIVMDGTHAAHFNYIGDSIIGKKCNLGAGAKFANLRFDGELIKVDLGETKLGSGLRKLGAILESNVQVGCNAVLNPGTYVAKKAMIVPGSVVSGFVK